MEQLRKIGEVLGSIKGLMIFSDETQLNSRQCSLLAFTFNLAFETIAEELRHGLHFNNLSAESKPLETPLRELYLLLREGEQFIKNSMDPNKKWLSKAVILHHNTSQTVQELLQNLLFCVSVIIEAVENVSESSSDPEELQKKKMILSKKYNQDWLDFELFQLMFGKQYLVTRELCRRFDEAAREDQWLLLEAIREMKKKKENDDKLAELLLAPRGKIFPSSFLVGSKEYTVRRRFGSGGSHKEVQWMGESFSVKHVIGDVRSVSEEVEFLAGVNHPNVWTVIYAFSDEEKEIFLLMDLMNKDLSTHIKENRSSKKFTPLPLNVTVDLMLQIAKGMEFLHSMKIFHGDLNPYNILVKPRSPANHHQDCYLHAKVTGFGPSAVAPPSPTPTGSPIWYGPEIISESEKQPTEKGDVYSFGMVCFEIITGKVPFEDGHLQGEKIGRNIRAGERPLFPSASPKCLTTLVKRCWHGEPGQRPGFSEICRVLRYTKRFFVINPDSTSPVTEVDYFDIETSLSRRWGGGRGVGDLPYTVFAYRVVEREKTNLNLKERNSESGDGEDDSYCVGGSSSTTSQAEESNGEVAKRPSSSRRRANGKEGKYLASNGSMIKRTGGKAKYI